jgi:hypothetical protein
VEETIKSTKTHYPSNPKPSFNPKREVRKETTKPREEAFVCMVCGRAGHLDEFCFHRKRIEKRHLDYARNSNHSEFTDFPPHFYSHAPSHTPSRVVSCFFHGTNYSSYGFGSREKCLDALIIAHVLIMVIISRIGMVFLLVVLTLALNQTPGWSTFSPLWFSSHWFKG